MIKDIKRVKDLATNIAGVIDSEIDNYPLTQEEIYDIFMQIKKEAKEIISIIDN